MCTYIHGLYKESNDAFDLQEDLGIVDCVQSFRDETNC